MDKDTADQIILPNSGEYYFYTGLMKGDFIKITSLFIKIVLFVTGTLLLYGVIWYERFSADIYYRTLLNQMVSHICMIHLFGGFVLMFGYIMIFGFQIQCQVLCNFIFFNARFFIVSSLTHLTVRQCIKCLYIFQRRFVTCVNDDFVAVFLLLCNVMLCGLYTFVAYFFGHHNAEINYHCCTGKAYSKNIKITLNLFKANGNSSMSQVWFQKRVGPGKDYFHFYPFVIQNIIQIFVFFTCIIKKHLNYKHENFCFSF